MGGKIPFPPSRMEGGKSVPSFGAYHSSYRFCSDTFWRLAAAPTVENVKNRISQFFSTIVKQPVEKIESFTI